VWSPIKLSDEVAEEINKLGLVKHLVSPNKLHYLYLEQWKKAYPDALIWENRQRVVVDWLRDSVSERFF